MPKSEGCEHALYQELCPECQSQQEQENKVGLATGGSANVISPAGTDTLKSKEISSFVIKHAKPSLFYSEDDVKEFIRQLKERFDYYPLIMKEIDKLSGGL